MRRFLKWGLGGIGALLAILLLTATFGASLVAAAILVSVMDRLEIRHDGIWTLDLDLWRGRAAIGPVEIGAAEGPATAERLRVDVALGDVFSGRFRAESIELAGFRASARREEDGSVLLPGRPVRKILDAAGGTASDAPPSEAEDGPGGWEYGVERVLVTDARALLTDVGGGEIDLVIDRLEIERLRSWEPDGPATYALEARVNDIGIVYEGEATPLSDTLRVTARGGLSDVTWAKIARFAGEDLDETLEGSVSTDAVHDLTLHPDGSIEGRSEGSATLTGARLETPAGEALAADEARLDLALDHDVGADGRPVLAGELALRVTAPSVATAEGGTVRLASLELGGEGLRIRDVSGEGRAGFAAGFAERFGVAAGAEGRAPSLARLLIAVFVALAEEALSRDLEVSGAPFLRFEGVEARVPGEGGAAALEASLARGEADVAALDLAVREDGAWRIAGDLSATLSDYAGDARVAGRTVTSRLDALRFAAEGIEADSDGERVSARLSYSIAMEGIDNETPEGGRLRVASISVASDGAELAGDDGFRGEVTGPLELAVDGVEGVGPTFGELSLSGRTLRVTMDRLGLERGDALRGVAAGSISMTEWSASRASDGMEASLGGLTMVLPPSQVTVAEGRIEVAPQGAAGDDDAAATEEEEDGAETPLGGVIPGPPPEPDGDAEARAAAPEAAPRPDRRPPPIAGEVDPGFTPPDPVIPPETAALPAPRPAAPEPADPVEGEAVAAMPEALPDDAFGVRLTEVGFKGPGPDGPVSLSGGGAQLALTRFDADRGERLRVSLDGSLALSDWRGRAGGFGGGVGGLELGADGLGVTAGGGGPLAVEGAFTLSASGLGAEADDLLGVGWRASLAALRLSIGEAGLEGEAIRARGGASLSRLEIDDTGDEAEALTLEAAELTGVGVADGRLTADLIRLDGLDATLTSGAIAAAGGGGDGDGGDEAPGDGAPAPPVEIGRVVLSPGSRIVYGHVTEAGTVRLALGVDRFEVGPVALRPDAGPTRFDVALRVNEVGSLGAEGRIGLPTAPEDLSASVSASGVSLPPFSPLLEAMMRIAIPSGRLSAGIDGTVDGGAVDAMVDLSLADFALRPLDAAAAAEFQRRFVVSPDYALDVLRGADGSITLTLPVSGTLEDPEIDLSSVIATAAGGVFASLLPPRWISDREVTAERLLLEFPPGAAEIPEAVSRRLEAGAADLVADATTPVLLCGRATLRDVEVVFDGPATAETVGNSQIATMRGLAERREVAVRAALTDRFGVPPDRLGQCENRFERTRDYPGVIVDVVRGDR